MVPAHRFLCKNRDADFTYSSVRQVLGSENHARQGGGAAGRDQNFFLPLISFPSEPQPTAIFYLGTPETLRHPKHSAGRPAPRKVSTSENFICAQRSLVEGIRWMDGSSVKKPEWTVINSRVSCHGAFQVLRLSWRKAVQLWPS